MELSRDGLHAFLQSPDWKETVNMFIAANCDDFAIVDANGQYTRRQFEVWRNFQEIVEQILDVALQSIGGSLQTLETALNESMTKTSTGPRMSAWQDILKKLLVYESFEDFAKMMASQRLPQNQQTDTVVSTTSSKRSSFQRHPRAQSKNEEKADNPKATEFRRRSQLLGMGFAEALVDVCLECSEWDATLEELVDQLAGMSTEAKATAASQPKQQRHTVQDAKAEDKEGQQDCLVALSARLGQTNPLSVPLEKQLSAAKVVMDAEAVSTDGKGARAQLLLWASSLQELWWEALTAHAEGVPFEKSCYGHSLGIVAWFFEIERVRMEHISTKEIEVLAESGARLPSLRSGTLRADAGDESVEERLVWLISRNDEARSELDVLHNRLSTILASENGQDAGKKKRRREEVEELYLFLKEMMHAGSTMANAASLLRGRASALQSCSQGGKLVMALLDMHVLEDELIFLRNCIRDELTGPTAATLDTPAVFLDRGLPALTDANQPCEKGESDEKGAQPAAALDEFWDALAADKQDGTSVGHEIALTGRTVDLWAAECLEDSARPEGGIDSASLVLWLQRRPSLGSSPWTEHDPVSLALGLRVAAEREMQRRKGALLSEDEKRRAAEVVSTTLLARHEEAQRLLLDDQRAKREAQQRKLREKLARKVRSPGGSEQSGATGAAEEADAGADSVDEGLHAELSNGLLAAAVALTAPNDLLRRHEEAQRRLLDDQRAKREAQQRRLKARRERKGDQKGEDDSALEGDGLGSTDATALYSAEDRVWLDKMLAATDSFGAVGQPLLRFLRLSSGDAAAAADAADAEGLLMKVLVDALMKKLQEERTVIANGFDGIREEIIRSFKEANGQKASSEASAAGSASAWSALEKAMTTTKAWASDCEGATFAGSPNGRSRYLSVDDEDRDVSRRKLSEHERKFADLECELRTQMRAKQRTLEERIRLRKVKPTEAWAAGGAEEKADLRPKKYGMLAATSAAESDESLLLRLNQALESVIALLHAEKDTLLAQGAGLQTEQINSSMLMSALEELVRRPAAEGPTALNLRELAASRSGVDAELRRQALLIKRQYNEDQNRLDLDLLVQQAKQRQALHRKLLRKQQRKGGEGTLSESKDESSKGGPTFYADMAARGLSLSPLVRRKGSF